MTKFVHIHSTDGRVFRVNPAFVAVYGSYPSYWEGKENLNFVEVSNKPKFTISTAMTLEELDKLFGEN